MNERPSAPREWLVERVRLGEASLEQLTPAERERLDALPEEDAALLREHPPEAVEAEIQRRLHVEAAKDRLRVQGGGAWLRWAPLAAAGALTAAIAVTVMPNSEEAGLRTGGDPSVRTKGTAALMLYRDGSGGAERLVSDDMAFEGDRLQLSLRLAEARQAVVVSLDGRGQVTLHWPESSAGQAPLLEAGSHPLPFSYELDDAPAFERFFLVLAESGLSVNAVLSAARALAMTPDAESAPLALPLSIEQVQLRLRKGEGR